MRVQVQKWGNSLALRIPKAFVHETHLCQGAVVDMGIKYYCKAVERKEIFIKKSLAWRE